MTLPDFLVEWPYGAIVIKGHRIGLYHVVADYQDGASVERLCEEYPDLSRELIENVLAFYQDNQAEVDAYVANVEEKMERHYANHQPRFDLEELRRRVEQKKQTGR